MRNIFGRTVALFVALAYGSLLASPLPSPAATTSTIVGSVHGQDGTPIAGANVALNGVVHLTKMTDNAGNFAFADVPTGLYSILVSKAGFTTYRDDNVAAFIGETIALNVVLAQSSFSSLKTIATVSSNAPGVAPINTSTAAISTISAATFENQGQQQVTSVLNETPGIFTTPYYPGNGNPSNGGSPSSPQTPQIRGGLPYETESLIDGHPVSVGSAGTFSPNLINPFLLQDVEVVKGPGSMPAEINYAINGTVNYITLEPTAENKSEALYGVDKWGGISAGFKLTGETKNHKIGYAAGYVTDGYPGPLQNFRFAGSQLPLDAGPPGGPYYVNGQQLAAVETPVGEGIGPSAFAPYDGMGIIFDEPLTGCCYTMDTGFHSASQLAKIVFNFSNNTSLKLSYLGGQSVTGNGDSQAYDTTPVGDTGLPAFTFGPCGTANAPLTLCNPFATGTSYNCASTGGGPACGSEIPFDLSSFNGLGYSWQQQNLFQGEFRTTLGQTGTLLARYYTGSLNNYDVSGSSTPLDVALGSAYGTVPLCPTGTTFDPSTPTAAGGTDPNGWLCLPGGGAPAVAPVNTTFNGQPATFKTASEANLFFTNDRMNGETLQLQEQLGQNTFTLAYDNSQQLSSSTTDEPSVGLIVFSPVAGSKQVLQTLSLRGEIPLSPRVLLNFGDYDLNYLSHYSITGGATWNDSSHSYNEPRAALTWQPNNDTIYRLSAGGSVAPPYISLVSSGGPTWSQIIGGVPAAGWVQDANNGDISAETAFSYDLGMDHRIARATSVSLDLYFTQLHDMFFTETSTVTGAAATGCPNQPCEVDETANLGVARYQGIEFELNHVPLYGFGWRLQGSLQRAYTYDLPPYFYCAGSTNPSTGVTTPPGPGCIYNTNLAVLPNVNFGGQATAIAGAPNGVAGARVPYASGYGEVSWLGHYGQYYNVGLKYFGNNNMFNEPAFFVLSANVRFKLNDHGTSVQLSGDNLAGAYDNPYVGFFNGIPLPLVQGAMQTNPLTGAPAPVSFAATAAGNYGPPTFRIILTQDF
ncbi:MAG TPA: TonB-dependent receptor [Candidatus Baltobacteraceae bacterium]|nr:TonB-dependent receptor [Candidatus Baltobacteraceae bacterium]